MGWGRRGTPQHPVSAHTPHPHQWLPGLLTGRRTQNAGPALRLGTSPFRSPVSLRVKRKQTWLSVFPKSLDISEVRVSFAFHLSLGIKNSPNKPRENANTLLLSNPALRCWSPCFVPHPGSGLRAAASISCFGSFSKHSQTERFHSRFWKMWTGDGKTSY